MEKVQQERQLKASSFLGELPKDGTKEQKKSPTIKDQGHTLTVGFERSKSSLACFRTRIQMIWYY